MEEGRTGDRLEGVLTQGEVERGVSGGVVSTRLLLLLPVLRPRRLRERAPDETVTPEGTPETSFGQLN